MGAGWEGSSIDLKSIFFRGVVTVLTDISVVMCVRFETEIPDNRDKSIFFVGIK